MIHSKVVQRLLDTKKHNLTQYIKILDTVVYRIKKQGFGAVIAGYGPAYYDPETKNKDAIAILTDIPPQFLKKHFRTISEDDQKPILVRIARLFNVRIDTEVEYSRFSEFLQMIQDAHDYSFDSYETDKMGAFISACSVIQDGLS